jgi:hypothetical protein
MRGRLVVDVGGDGDGVAPIDGDEVLHVRGDRPERGGTLGLALEPPFDLDDRMSDGGVARLG